MRHTLLASLFAFFVLAALPARADLSTPFVEGANSKVDAVSEAGGYVVAITTNGDTSLLVIVVSDTREYIVIRATADKGIVPPELVGTWAMIKAQVVKAPTKSGHGEGAELKILGVTAPKKKG